MAFPEEPVLDPSYLYESADGDLEFMEAVLREYVDGTAENVAALRAAFVQGDRLTLCRAAHSVKGASASVGALRVMSAAARLEALANDDALDLADVLIELELEFEHLSTLVARGNALLVVSALR